MKRLYVVALVGALAGCAGSPTAPTAPPNIAGAWDWFQVVPRQGGGFNENPSGLVVTFQQAGGSLAANVTANNNPQVLASGTGAVTANGAFTMQLPAASEVCGFTGTVETATAITGTVRCPPNPSGVGFAFRKR